MAKKYNNADICNYAHVATKGLCQKLKIIMEEDKHDAMEYTVKAQWIFDEIHSTLEEFAEEMKLEKE